MNMPLRWIWLWDESIDRTIDAGIEAVALATLVALLLVVIGGTSRSLPHCRRCGADLRRIPPDGSHATARVCACGADPSRRGAVRWRGRARSRKWIVGLAAVFLVGTSMRVWSLDPDRRWRDFRTEASLMTVLESDPLAVDERAFAIAASEMAKRIATGKHTTEAPRRAFRAITDDARRPMANASWPLRSALHDHADDAHFAEISGFIAAAASGTVTHPSLELDGTCVDLTSAGVTPSWPWWIARSGAVASVRRVTVGDDLLWDVRNEHPPDRRLRFKGSLAESPRGLFSHHARGEPLLAIDGLEPGVTEIVVEFEVRRVPHSDLLGRAGLTLDALDARAPDLHRAERRIVQPLVVHPAPSPRSAEAGENGATGETAP